MSGHNTCGIVYNKKELIYLFPYSLMGKKCCVYIPQFFTLTTASVFKLAKARPGYK